jgi:hypothetical protein
MFDTILIISAPFLLIAVLYPVFSGTCRVTKGRFGGVAWVFLGLYCQWRYWHTHHAPYVPLLKPSILMLVCFTFTAIGIWIMARMRTTGAWKWAFVGLVPIVGPLFAVSRLVLLPVVRPRGCSLGKLAMTIVPGFVFAVFFAMLAPLTSSQDEAVEAPNEGSRVLIISENFVGHPLFKLEWQRLVGPFIIDTRSFHAASHRHAHIHKMRHTFSIRWSEDSSRILVTSHSAELVESAKPPGDALYVMYDVRSQKVWCNAVRNCNDAPRFSEDDIVRISWFPAYRRWETSVPGTESGGPISHKANSSPHTNHPS